MYNPIQDKDPITSAWGNAIEDALGSGTPAQPHMYTLWKDGSTYYARHGLTGERTSNDNFKDFMNTLILDLYDAGAGTGGSIFLNSAPYYANGTINMRPGIHIYGGGQVGRDDRLKLTTAIIATTDAPIFSFDIPTNTVGADYHMGVHNMGLYGNDVVSTNALIDIQCNSEVIGDVFLSDLDIYTGASAGSSKYGIRVYNNHATNRIWDLFIERCMIEAFGYNAILIDSPTNAPIFQCRLIDDHFYGNCVNGGNGAVEIDGHETRGGQITNCTFELENRNGIYLADEADAWVIANNIIIDAGQKTDNTYSGISLNDVDLCSITGNVSIYRANNKMKYGYYTDNNSDFLCCIGNVFKGQTAGAVFGTGAGNIGDATMNVSTT